MNIIRKFFAEFQIKREFFPAAAGRPRRSSRPVYLQVVYNIL